jgi:hypothetical protein
MNCFYAILLPVVISLVLMKWIYQPTIARLTPVETIHRVEKTFARRIISCLNRRCHDARQHSTLVSVAKADPVHLDDLREQQLFTAYDASGTF